MSGSKANDPNVTMLDRPLARLLIALYDDAVQLGPPPFPAISSLSWGQLQPSSEGAELQFHDNELDLILTSLGITGPERFAWPKRRTDGPAIITFGDGTALTATLPALTRRNSTLDEHGARERHIVSLVCWTWQPQSPAHYWVAEVEGRPLKVGNLDVRRQHNCGTRMESSYDVHLLTTRSGRLYLIVDTHGAPLDQDLLGHEMQALEFGMGSSVRLGTLLALDSDHRPVGAANAGFDSHDTRSNRHPVPGSGWHEHGYWPTVFASAVARKLQDDHGEDAPCLLASTAYRDSLSGHVHKKYLLAQVALEALAQKLVPKKDGEILIKEVQAWQEWIVGVEGRIRELAKDAESADILLKRLKDGVFQPSARKRVAAALDHYDLKVPKEALDEVGLRNDVAHSFVMFKKEMPDGNDLVRRIAIIQTLLVALAAKYVGYTGPILGWELDESRWPKIPGWWPHKDAPEAHRIFVAADDEPESSGENANEQVPS